MKIFRALLLLVVAMGCSSEQSPISGKWYAYAESGDYMELWLAEDRALSYLSGIDEFLLYDLERNGNEMSFSLIESRIVDEHEFQLKVEKSSEKIFQAIFIGNGKADSLKTYFLISSDTPVIGSNLKDNTENMSELFARLEGSHDGHGH